MGAGRACGALAGQKEVSALSGETKPVETELKLVLASQEADLAVIAYLGESGYTVEQLDPVRNVDTYLDTFDWSLLKNKLALRFRISNGTAMYTLKSIEPIEDGIAKRMETEILLDKPVDVPTRVPVKPIRKLVDGIIFPRKLLEQIQIRTDRRRYRLLSPEGAEIELAFDTSSFSLRGLHKPRRTQRLNELEAEIRDGSEAALEALSSLLSSKFNYPASTASKFEVAIERFKITIPSKKPPEKLRVRLDDRLDVAVQKILTYQMHRFQEQLPGVQRDIDTEFVHQARVATRRMRSALRLFRDAIPEGTAAYLRGELKWLGGMLGAIRDLDVFLLNLSRFKQQIERFPAKKKQAFENWIEKRRRAPLKALRRALESPRYKHFERRMMQFFERPLPLRPRAPLALKPVREVAPASHHREIGCRHRAGPRVTRGSETQAIPSAPDPDEEAPLRVRVHGSCIRRGTRLLRRDEPWRSRTALESSRTLFLPGNSSTACSRTGKENSSTRISCLSSVRSTSSRQRLPASEEKRSAKYGGPSPPRKP